MRAVLTRVSSASVTIDNQVVGRNGKGFLILLGIGPEDTETQCRYLAEKALSLRIFEDDQGKMNLGLDQVGGQVLVVSQFTLYADCRKGNRPGFTAAGDPKKACALYERMVEAFSQRVPGTAHGSFGADMKVSLVNDGPFTLVLDSSQLFGAK